MGQITVPDESWKEDEAWDRHRAKLDHYIGPERREPDVREPSLKQLAFRGALLLLAFSLCGFLP